MKVAGFAFVKMDSFQPSGQFGFGANNNNNNNRSSGQASNGFGFGSPQHQSQSSHHQQHKGDGGAGGFSSNFKYSKFGSSSQSRGGGGYGTRGGGTFYGSSSRGGGRGGRGGGAGHFGSSKFAGRGGYGNKRGGGGKFGGGNSNFSTPQKGFRPKSGGETGFGGFGSTAQPQPSSSFGFGTPSQPSGSDGFHHSPPHGSNTNSTGGQTNANFGTSGARQWGSQNQNQNQTAKSSGLSTSFSFASPSPNPNQSSTFSPFNSTPSNPGGQSSEAHFSSPFGGGNRSPPQDGAGGFATFGGGSSFGGKHGSKSSNSFGFGDKAKKKKQYSFGNESSTPSSYHPPAAKQMLGKGKATPGRESRESKEKQNKFIWVRKTEKDSGVSKSEESPSSTIKTKSKEGSGAKMSEMERLKREAISRMPTFAGGGGGGSRGTGLLPKKTPRKTEKAESDLERMKREAVSNMPTFAGGSSKGSSSSAFKSPKPSKAIVGDSQQYKKSSNFVRKKVDEKSHTGESEAERIIGTCESMCPLAELERRFRTNDFDELELPNSDYPGMSVEDLTVKRFARTITEEDRQPDRLRTSGALKRTMNHLLSLMDSKRTTFEKVHRFLWDRYRAIRTDLSIQHMKDTFAIQCFEEMIRFHIIAEHELCEETATVNNPHGFNSHLNVEQMYKCLTSLFSLYDDLAEEGTSCPNEPEFRGYYILLTIDTHGKYRRDKSAHSFALSKTRPEILHSDFVRFAVQLNGLYHEGNFVKFFSVVRKCPFVISCILHAYFDPVRARAMKLFSQGVYGRNRTLPVADIQEMLLMDSAEDVIALCQSHGLQVQEGQEGVGVTVGQNNFQEITEAVLRKCSQFISSKRSNTRYSDCCKNAAVITPELLPKERSSNMGSFRGKTMSPRKQSESLLQVKPMPEAVPNIPESKDVTVMPAASTLASNEPSSKAAAISPTIQPHSFSTPPTAQADTSKRRRELSISPTIPLSHTKKISRAEGNGATFPSFAPAGPIKPFVGLVDAVQKPAVVPREEQLARQQELEKRAQEAENERLFQLARKMEMKRQEEEALRRQQLEEQRRQQLELERRQRLEEERRQKEERVKQLEMKLKLRFVDYIYSRLLSLHYAKLWRNNVSLILARREKEERMVQALKTCSLSPSFSKAPPHILLEERSTLKAELKEENIKEKWNEEEEHSSETVERLPVAIPHYIRASPCEALMEELRLVLSAARDMSLTIPFLKVNDAIHELLARIIESFALHVAFSIESLEKNDFPAMEFANTFETGPDEGGDGENLKDRYLTRAKEALKTIQQLELPPPTLSEESSNENVITSLYLEVEKRIRQLPLQEHLLLLERKPSTKFDYKLLIS